MSRSHPRHRAFAVPFVVPFDVRPLAWAAAAALLACAAAPARAQFFSSSGADSTFPTNLFPIDPFAATLDLGANTLSIGNGAPGSFAAMAGGLLKANGLQIGMSGTGSGSVTLTGAGTRAELGGPIDRLYVGSYGTGSLTVSAGAVLDATVNAAACPVSGGCYSAVGNAAGSTGTLAVTGTGSEVHTLRNFIIGQSYVAADGSYGTAGATTNATVNVTAGGLLRTENSTVGANYAAPGSNGNEQVFATVTVDGAGSRWLVGRNSIDNTAAGLTLGASLNGNANVTVKNGGTLSLDGGGVASQFDFVNIGVNGGNGALTVTGVGSSVVVNGTNGIIQVGRSGASAQGSFSVLAGATASTLLLNVGRDGATGTMTIDGAGSQLIQSGVGTPGTSGAAFANIGRDGGIGQATVSNGGYWKLSDGGGNSLPGGNSPDILVGRGLGGIGSLTISGAGSKVEIVSTSMAPAADTGDNFNPFVGVGYDTGSSGQLTVSSGGKLVLTGAALSTAANQRNTAINIGGKFTGSGDGSATVTGSGSEINVSGVDAFIGIGRGGGTGSLSIANLGKVSSTSVVVGESGGGGTLSIDNGTLALSGHRTSDLNTGAGMTVGRGIGGVGTMSLTNGAKVTIANDLYTGGMSVGGDRFVAGGTGTVTLSGGSSIELLGPVLGGGITVGDVGTGTMALTGASSIALGDSGTFNVGRTAGSIGTVSLGGGSVISAGALIIAPIAGATGTMTIDGVGTQFVASGTSTTNVSPFVQIGRGGGTAVMSVTGGGTLLITDDGGDTRAGNGSLGMNVGRDAGGSGKLTIAGAGSTVQIVSTSLGLAPGVNDNFNPFAAIGRFTGASGELMINSGGKLLMTGNAVSTVANSHTTSLNIGGTLDSAVGDPAVSGTGTATVTGAGSEIRVSGSDAFIAVGRGSGGVGQLTIANQGLVSATNMNVGRGGGTGTLSMNNGSLSMTGQQTGNNLSGASLSIGNLGGTGSAVVTNNSHIDITNMGSAGASLSLGGTAPNPLGTGSMILSGGSRIQITATAGNATLNVGRDGTGSLTASGASTIDLGLGRAFIGRETTGSGVMTLTGASTLTADYVGVGISTGAGADGGTGKLVVSHSTVNATTVQIGSKGYLGGSEGVINGMVLNSGIVAPGESPGRLVVNGGFTNLGGGQLLLDVAANGSGGFDVDHLVLTQGSSFDFSNVKVTFNFLGSTDPTAFAASGGFNLDNFVQSRATGTTTDTGLSTVFASGEKWTDVLQTATFAATSSVYDVTKLDLSGDNPGSFTVAAVPVPEPGTWALTFTGLFAIWLRRRKLAVASTGSA